MGKQGRPTSAPIQQFVEDTCRNTPGLNNRQLAAMVAEQFGEGGRVDRSTVGRIRKMAGLVGATGPALNDGLRVDPVQWERHRGLVLAPLDNLSGIYPLEVGNPDLMNLYLRLETPYWPVPKARVWRRDDRELTLHLRCAHDCEIECRDDEAWLCLSQHFEDHQLLKAKSEGERTIPQDLSDRLKLLGAIQDKASRPEEEGGIGLKLIPDLSTTADASQMGYGPYYLFTILHQGMSRGLNLRLMPKRKEEFQLRPPCIIELGGYPVVQAADPLVRYRAVDWLLEMQDAVVTWPEGLRAVQTYTKARESCLNIQRQLDLLQLQVGLPEGSRCDICRSWAGN